MNETENMTEQNPQDNKRAPRIKCEYCGGRIELQERVRVKVDVFKKRESDPTNINPENLLVRNYHKKCYMERYKDYMRLKGENENGNNN